jgi:DNA-binding response OmpR family regulator
MNFLKEESIMKENSNPQRILVVDDEEPIRLLYKTELEEEGFEVLSTSKARRALELVGSEAVDLVVLDIQMPDMDGIEALQKIVGKKRNMPVIINSAYPNFKDNFMTWIADAYVVKSPDLRELKDKIRSTLCGVTNESVH